MKAVAAKKAALELECIQKESDARIAAAATATTANSSAAPAAAPQKLGSEDDALDEVPPEVQTLTIHFAGLPQEEIVKIFHNKFKPINLYWLRHMRGHRYESYHDQDRIGMKTGMLRLKKNSGTYKDFGKTFYEVWSEAFINYTGIMVSLFGSTSPELHAALTIFYGNILQLARVYEWQEAVLPMTIEVHTHVVSQQPSDASKWIIPPEFRGRFCNPTTLLGTSSLQTQNKRKRSRSPPSRRVAKQPGGATNNLSVICEVFNKGSCSWTNCERAHKCKSCGSKEHGLVSCQKGKTGNV